MKSAKFLTIMLSIFAVTLLPRAAHAQRDNNANNSGSSNSNNNNNNNSNDDNAPAASPDQVREEVRQLMADMQNPNYDYATIPQRMRQTFRDFRNATSGMDPQAAREFGQELFSQIGPIIQANRAKIDEARRMEFLKSLQEPLGCSDDEFAALRPYLEKVVEAAEASQLNPFRPPRNGNGNNNQNPSNNRPNSQPQPQTPVEQAADDLQTALEDNTSSSDLIKNKLDVLRQAQQKAHQDLQVARTNLKQLLTLRQEAVLVRYGLLDY